MIDSGHPHTVAYEEADVEVLVEIFRDVMVFGCLPGYKSTFKKYNMQAIQGQTVYCEDLVERPVVRLADLIKQRQIKESGELSTPALPEVVVLEESKAEVPELKDESSSDGEDA